MDLFDIAIARKLSGGSGGGGGSSDFSTAEVTITNNLSHEIILYISNMEDDELGINSFFEVVAVELQTTVIPAILYKGKAVGCLIDPTTNDNTIDGIYICADGIADDGDQYVIVTGNGTITIS